MAQIALTYNNYFVVKHLCDYRIRNFCFQQKIADWGLRIADLEYRMSNMAKQIRNQKSEIRNYDVVVIGAGHAGTEAAAAAARCGARVAMFTKSPDDIGALSCNPSVGGPGKSQIIAEIDALGGIMPRAADASGIHFRLLNRKNGPATQALRAQLCRDKYRKAIKDLLPSEIDIIYEPVIDLDLENKTVNGKYSANAIVITTGTFLNGLIHMGDEKIESGRMMDSGEYAKSCTNISKTLKKAGFSLIRLKTGTPARLYADSIDFTICEPQPSDENHEWFSGISDLGFRISDLSEQKNKSEINCYITRTTSETHEIIRNNIEKAPMYNGEIESTGPRYCPSIEDKIMRFPEHTSQQIFLEPETVCGTIIYPNGISTSLPRSVQDEFIKSIPALCNARIEKYGYAIEYDAIDARALKTTLESKDISGIFFAGQINGTSGYEEAAGQGIVAGANAASFVKRECVNRESQDNKDLHDLRLNRTNSFIGVMIDDITTTNLDEPYRMFTSR
ncbi:MAG: tRNA uridine-5-carboxymethylaminomethyl(34) synthesis enzyme MnmG, partial [Alphaproteobacteria bacterium]|nr:tRNA uridine-5-carboxymethylaminomethyl(34) synthesis enzyme MnmG [Alphaproteobacteria bacterium]